MSNVRPKIHYNVYNDPPPKSTRTFFENLKLGLDCSVTLAGEVRVLSFRDRSDDWVRDSGGEVPKMFKNFEIKINLETQNFESVAIGP